MKRSVTRSSTPRKMQDFLSNFLLRKFSSIGQFLESFWGVVINVDNILQLQNKMLCCCM